MAVREFTDENGRKWLAWDIRPEAIHPVTKAEDYLADCYVTGWIVFETKVGDQKRRLCPWPTRWAEGTEEDLRMLLRRAEIVPDHKLQAEREIVPDFELDPAKAPLAEAASQAPDVTDLHVVRTFRYPGGRFWTVSVIPRPEDGGPPVLRFAAGMRSIDLRRWRKDWAGQPEEILVWMLRRAAPRPPSQTPPEGGIPMRRWDDEQPRA